MESGKEDPAKWGEEQEWGDKEPLLEGTLLRLAPSIKCR